MQRRRVTPFYEKHRHRNPRSCHHRQFPPYIDYTLDMLDLGTPRLSFACHDIPPFHPVINEHSNNMIGTMIHMTEDLVDTVPCTRNPSPQQLPFDHVLRVVDTSPSHASLSIDLDVRDLVIVGGFDPETALVPPLRALRDLFNHEVLYGPLRQLLTGEIEALLASSAESARSRASDMMITACEAFFIGT